MASHSLCPAHQWFLQDVYDPVTDKKYPLFFFAFHWTVEVSASFWYSRKLVILLLQMGACLKAAASPLTVGNGVIFSILRKITAGEDEFRLGPSSLVDHLGAEEEQEYGMHWLGVASIALNLPSLQKAELILILEVSKET